MRKLPGVCRYPAEGTGQPVKQGGIADKIIIRPWQKIAFCRGRMFFTPSKKRRSFFIRKEHCHGKGLA